MYGTATYKLSTRNALKVDFNGQYFDRYGEFQDFSFLTHRNRLTYLNGFARTRFIRSATEDDKLGLEATLAISTGRPTSQDHVAPNSPGFYYHRQMGYTAIDGVVDANYNFSSTNILTLGFDFTSDREQLMTLELTNEATGQVTEAGADRHKTLNNWGG